MSTLERAIEDVLVDAVEALGGKALKLRPPTGRGFPDRTCLHRGRTAFVEVKRPVGGRFAKHQAEWFKELVTTGFACFRVSDERDIEYVIDFLKQETDR